jgi:NAD-dependent DNA ligase
LVPILVRVVINKGAMDTSFAKLDVDAQPLNLAWNRQRRVDAAIDELIGLIRGIVADDEVSERETIKLAEWTQLHPDVVNDWPANVVVRRINRIFDDGRVDGEEREELKELLLEVIGQNDVPLTTAPTELPLSRPAPEIIFDQNVFVFTGKFVYGPRRVCEAEVLERGGRTSNSVTLDTAYVVIGSIGSRDWIHSSWGRKIEKAVDYRSRELCPIAVVSEQRWTSFLLRQH